MEGVISNACNAVRDFNACKAGATTERRTSNACYAVRDCNACKPVAITERSISNACNAVGSTVVSDTFRDYDTAGVLI